MAARGALVASAAAASVCCSASSQPQAPPRAAHASCLRAASAPRAACTRRRAATRVLRREAAVARGCARHFALAAARDDAGDAEKREWQSLLGALRACAPDALEPLVSARRAAISTRFMLWLADEAAAAEARGDADAASLETLCGLVVVARDRVEDGRSVLAQLASTDPCVPPAAPVLARAAPAADARFEDFAALAQQLSPGSADLEAELSRRWSALALRGEVAAPEQAGLNAASRRTAVAEIMGRAALEGAQPEDVLAPQPEERILAALLAIPDEAERLAAVDDALTPPEAGTVDDGAGDEQLSTTPLQLLRAIDLSLQRLQRGAPHLSASLLLAGGGSADAAALERLRATVLARL